MTLDKNKFAVRYYLWLVRVFDSPWAARERLESGTNLCAFFWRIVLCSAVIAAGTSFCLLAAALFVYALIVIPLQVAIVVGCVVGCFLSAVAFAFVVFGAKRLAQSENLVFTYIKSAKRGLCPLIKFSAN